MSEIFSFPAGPVRAGDADDGLAHVEDRDAPPAGRRSAGAATPPTTVLRIEPGLLVILLGQGGDLRLVLRDDLVEEARVILTYRSLETAR